MVEYCYTGMARMNVNVPENAIDVGRFSAALSAEERVPIKLLMMLCDRERRRPVLERMFTPTQLWKCIDGDSYPHAMDQQPVQEAVEGPGDESEKRPPQQAT